MSDLDKFETNRILIDRGLPVAHSTLLEAGNIPRTLLFPLFVKPVRGHGGVGVYYVRSQDELAQRMSELAVSGEFGTTFIIEEALPGDELSIIVNPSGIFDIDDVSVVKENTWAETPIRLSARLTSDEASTPEIARIMFSCEEAAAILRIRAPVRIDCREDVEGFYRIFDFNWHI